MRLEPLHEARRSLSGRGRVPDHASVRDTTCRRLIGRNERIERGRMHLEDVRAAQDAAAQHGIHAAPSIRRHAQCIEQISRRVRALRAHRQHRSGHDDRPVDMRQEMMQQRRRARERVRAVRDDKAVIRSAFFPDRPRHLHPVVRCDVGRVALHQIEYLDPAHLGKPRQLAQQPLPVEHGRQTVPGLAAGDRAARCDQQDLSCRIHVISHEFLLASS